jgi:DnaJ-class molecular chaperone
VNVELVRVTCPDCDGHGVLVDCRGYACSHENDREYECRACQGTGTVLDISPDP